MNERERLKGISKDFWESLSVVRYYKYASDADGSDSLGKARSPSILWLSVFLRSSELSEELKCQILAVCAACTITLLQVWLLVLFRCFKAEWSWVTQPFC